MSAFGQRLRQLRTSCSLTLRQLAERTGLSPSHLCAIERGSDQASSKALEALARAYQMTVASLTAGLWRPSPRSQRKLRTRGTLLRRLFSWVPPRLPESTLAVMCREAGFYRLGKSLVEQLRAQRRPAPFWSAAKLYLHGQNGAEQVTSLHLFERAVDLEDIEPQFVRFPRPVVQEPGRRWIALVLEFNGFTILVYPQVTICGLTGQYPTLDFLVCLSDGVSNAYIDLEIDGPGHEGRRFKDAERDVVTGLPVLRVPLPELDRGDFAERLLERVVASRLR
ncbi:MAG: helix-turn-helix domain-containing protein [Proteobacteria bacterium]|nr:helix-turn-helix domain-containing protein [Pseudomonadota bacterium]